MIRLTLDRGRLCVFVIVRALVCLWCALPRDGECVSGSRVAWPVLARGAWAVGAWRLLTDTHDHAHDR